MRNNKNKIYFLKSGYILIELLVVFIILVTLMAIPLALYKNSNVVNSNNPNKIQAALLADEAMAVVRSTYHSNILAGIPWDTTLKKCAANPGGHEFCYVGYPFSCYSSPSCPTVFTCGGDKPILGKAFEGPLLLNDRKVFNVLSDPLTYKFEYTQANYWPLDACIGDKITAFRRIVEVSPSIFPWSDATVTVTWNEAGTTQTYLLKMRLFPI